MLLGADSTSLLVTRGDRRQPIAYPPGKPPRAESCLVPAQGAKSRCLYARLCSGAVSIASNAAGPRPHHPGPSCALVQGVTRGSARPLGHIIAFQLLRYPNSDSLRGLGEQVHIEHYKQEGVWQSALSFRCQEEKVELRFLEASSNPVVSP